MKTASTLLLTGLLLAALPAAASAPPSPEIEPPTPTQDTVQTLAAELEEIAPAELETNCDPAELALLEDGIVLAMGQTCGACSTPNCNGATRGQLCWTGPQFGWGNCNIFSGGFMCPTGGWDCQCRPFSDDLD